MIVAEHFFLCFPPHQLGYTSKASKNVPRHSIRIVRQRHTLKESHVFENACTVYLAVTGRREVRLANRNRNGGRRCTPDALCVRSLSGVGLLERLVAQEVRALSGAGLSLFVLVLFCSRFPPSYFRGQGRPCALHTHARTRKGRKKKNGPKGNLTPRIARRSPRRRARPKTKQLNCSGARRGNGEACRGIVGVIGVS